MPEEGGGRARTGNEKGRERAPSSCLREVSPPSLPPLLVKSSLERAKLQRKDLLDSLARPFLERALPPRLEPDFAHEKGFPQVGSLASALGLLLRLAHTRSDSKTQVERQPSGLVAPSGGDASAWPRPPTRASSPLSRSLSSPTLDEHAPPPTHSALAPSHAPHHSVARPHLRPRPRPPHLAYLEPRHWRPRHGSAHGQQRPQVDQLRPFHPRRHPHRP